jgi:hypothetical protein
VKKVLVIKDINLNTANISIFGDMLSYFKGDGLYLSGNSYFLNFAEYDFFSGIKNLSAFYPPFSGRPVPYNIINNNQIRFKVPNDLPAGEYDIIFCNPAGYVKASTSTEFALLSIIHAT